MKAKLALTVGLLALMASPGMAQLNRSAVSVQGVDTNPCTPAQPCRTFGAAHNQTNARGEIIVLDSGGYGVVTITKSLSLIAAPGVYAGITAPFDGTAVSVSLPTVGRVVLRGLSLEGLGGADYGIAFTSGGGLLQVENCTINNFSEVGILSFFDIMVSATTIRGIGKDGIRIDNAAAPVRAVLDGVNTRNCSQHHVWAFRNAVITMRNANAAGSLGYGFGANNTSAFNIENCLVMNMANTGIQSTDVGTKIRVSNCIVSDNNTGMRANYGGTLETWQNNEVRGNVTNLDATFPVAGTITPVPQN